MKKYSALLMAAALSAAIFLSGCGAAPEGQTEPVFQVYFGLNDADTGEQELTVEEVAAHIRDVLAGHNCGYTEYRAYGAYTEDGVSRGNDTLVYMLAFVEETEVEVICSEVAEQLNLSSVLCQKGEMESRFFGRSSQ